MPAAVPLVIQKYSESPQFVFVFDCPVDCLHSACRRMQAAGGPSDFLVMFRTAAPGKYNQRFLQDIPANLETFDNSEVYAIETAAAPASEFYPIEIWSHIVHQFESCSQNKKTRLMHGISRVFLVLISIVIPWLRHRA